MTIHPRDIATDVKADPAGNPAERCSSFFHQAAQRSEAFFSRKFSQLGLLVGRRPILMVFLSLCVTLACCSGFARLYIEDQSDKLWTPQDTRAIQDSKTFSAYFPPKSRMAFLLLESKTGNALDKSFLQEALALHWKIENINSTVGVANDNLRTLCIQRPLAGLPCFVNSIFEVWGYNLTRLSVEGDPIVAINAAGKSKSDLQGMFGSATFADGKIIGAKALTIRYLLQSNVDSTRKDPRAEAWEAQLLNLLKCDTTKCDSGACACGYESTSFWVFPQAARSFGDVFGSVVRGDVGLINGVFIIMIIWLICNLGGLCHKIKSRVLLSCGALVTIVAAGLAGYGISMWCALPYTPMHSVLPFVLLAIGIDETFVIMGSVDRTDPTKEIPERISEALGHIGLSILVTTLTDFIGFVISANSSIPALSSFCVYAGLSLLFMCAFQFTLFLAFVSWDLNRRKNNQIDCCFCLPRGCPCCPTVENEAALQAVEAGARDPNLMCPYRPSKHKGGYLGQFLEQFVAPFLIRQRYASIVVLCFLTFFAIMCWQTSLLKMEDTQRSFLPDDSYLLATMDKMNEYYASMGTRFNIMTLPGDYFTAQGALLQTRSRLEGLDFVVTPSGDSFDSWAEAFRSACITNQTVVTAAHLDARGLVTDQSQYYASLKSWLKSNGQRYKTDVIWADSADPQKGIVATKFMAELVSVKTVSNNHIIPDAMSAIRAMDGIRAACDSWTDFPAGKVVTYTFEFSSWEGLKLLSNAMYWSIAECLIVVMVVTSLTLVNAKTTFFVLLCVGFTTVDVMGCMKLWGLNIDSVSVIYAVIGIGLCVDYATHVGHDLMSQVGSPAERVYATMGEIGADVITGGISTFLGVLLLALSKSYVFRVMFQVFFLTVVIGVAHGLLFLPALSILTSMPDSHEEQRTIGKVVESE